MLKILILILLSGQALGQELHFKNVSAVPDASFRGLSVVDDSVVWVSGSKGAVGRSDNGGRDWTFQKVKGFEQCDFRTLYAFDARTAIIANAGQPPIVLRTGDGGVSWKMVYKNDDTTAFFDGVGFWNQKDGILYGDPLQGRIMILLTHDGGRTWKEIPESKRPLVANGEASFAASGTNIKCLGRSKAIIATGGKTSRLLFSDDNGMNWRAVATPIIQGVSTTGIFSVAFLNEKTGIIAGGDYKRETLKKDHIFYTKNGGTTWSAPAAPTGGYRECVAYLDPETVIATGPGGTDISGNGGASWRPLSDEKGFHVAGKSRKGNLIVMAGAGKISVAEAGR